MQKALIITLVILIFSFGAVKTYAIELKDIPNLFRNSQTQNNGELLEQTKIGQEKFHEPTVNGQKIKAVPYLLIPFSRDDFQEKNIKITEGWLYSFNEYDIHGMEVHAGVDFSAPYGTNIYAPADGYVMSSYHNLFAKDKYNKVILDKGKKIKYGLGLFIRMYIPKSNRFVDLAHLSEINELIPFSDSEFNEEEEIWNPTNHTVLIKDIPANHGWVKVTKGQLLGKVGTSGLEWGYEDFKEKPGRKVTLDPRVNQSWDEPHLHFEEFSHIENPQEAEEEGQKVAPRDIFGIYSFVKDYPSLNQKLSQRLKPLILSNKDGLPLFAR